MEIFEIPVYDDDFIKLVFRLVINLFVVTVLIRLIYAKHSQNKEYLFTFFMLNVLVFFICFTLKKFELDLGMALGLFAIFGILRYRTSTIPNKEMTYLFTVIGIAVINALSNKKMSFTEVAFTNAFILVMAALLEKLLVRTIEHRETIIYERIDMLRPEKHDELIQELQERTGIAISRLEISKINYLNDTAIINMYYHPSDQKALATNGMKVDFVSYDYD